jgi:hypothetical protein
VWPTYTEHSLAWLLLEYEGISEAEAAGQAEAGQPLRPDWVLHLQWYSD